jgi:hypothetical protein
VYCLIRLISFQTLTCKISFTDSEGKIHWVVDICKALTPTEKVKGICEQEGKPT